MSEGFFPFDGNHVSCKQEGKIEALSYFSMIPADHCCCEFNAWRLWVISAKFSCLAPEVQTKSLRLHTFCSEMLSNGYFQEKNNLLGTISWRDAQACLAAYFFLLEIEKNLNDECGLGWLNQLLQPIPAWMLVAQNICIKKETVIFNLGFLFFSSRSGEALWGAARLRNAVILSGHTGMLCGMAIPQERAAAVGAASEDSAGK